MQNKLNIVSYTLAAVAGVTFVVGLAVWSGEARV